MTLNSDILEAPVSDLSSETFQLRLREGLNTGFLAKLLVAFAVTVSLALIIVAITVIGRLDGSYVSLEALFVATMGASGVFVLFVLWRRYRLRMAYLKLLNGPEGFALREASITKVSSWALPAVGSDLNARRLSWGGLSPGSATVETIQPRFVTGHRITVAVPQTGQGGLSLLVSLHPLNSKT